MNHIWTTESNRHLSCRWPFFSKWGINYVDQSTSHIPTNTSDDNPFLHHSDPCPISFNTTTCAWISSILCTCQHEQFQGKHIRRNGHTNNCLYAGNSDMSFERPIMQLFCFFKERAPILVRDSTPNPTSHGLDKFSCWGGVHQFYPGNKFLFSSMETLSVASGCQVMHTLSSCELSWDKVHQTLSQSYDVKYPEITPPRKCYP